MTGDSVKLVRDTIPMVADGHYKKRKIIVGKVQPGDGEAELNFLSDEAQKAGIVLIYDPDTTVVELLRPTR